MLNIKNVTKIYGEGTAQVVALRDVCLDVTDGDFVSIMGPRAAVSQLCSISSEIGKAFNRRDSYCRRTCGQPE